MTGPKGAVTRYEYDPAGRQIAATDPLGRATRQEYDQAGRMARLIDPSGHAQSFGYDPMSRLTQHAADDGTEVSFSYDKAGRRTSMTDATGTTHYAYDAAGHLVAVTGPDGEQIAARYDAAGQTTAVSYPGGHEVSYDYAPGGRLDGLTDSRAGQVGYALDPDGRLVTEQLPGRFARRYHYENGLLRRFQVIRDDRLVAETFLSYDPDGRIVAEHSAGRSREYAYDPAGQLIRVTVRDDDRDDERGRRPAPGRAGQPGRIREELRISYDAAGNRVFLHRESAETRYRYDDADQLEGSETRERRTEYHYDSSGRLTEEIEGQRRRIIEYDGFGRPARVTRHAPGAETERISATFDGDDLLAGLVLTSEDERREERSASVRYRWSGTDEIPQILTQRAEPELDDAERDRPGRLSTDFTYGYNRAFASWEDGAETFHSDVLSSALRTEETAPWAEADFYGVFGSPEGPQRRDDPRRRPGPPELPRFGYRGELALGPMIYLRARAYDSSLGRFTTRDPVPPQPGVPWNPYAYAASDPLNITDPGGKCILPFGCGLIKRGEHDVVAGGKKLVHLAEDVGSGIARVVTWPIQHIIDPVTQFVQRIETAFQQVVLGEEIQVENLEDELLGKILTVLGIIRILAKFREAVVLDTGAASGLCFAADPTIPAEIHRSIGLRSMLMPQTADNEFQTAVKRVMKPRELELAAVLYLRIIVIPDDPSPRVTALRITRAVEALDKIIFGTADKLGVVIFTNNIRFVRGAEAQGVNLRYEITRPVKLGESLDERDT